MALIPEDRKNEGLVLRLSVTDNLILSSLRRLKVGPFLDHSRIAAAVTEAIGRLRIKIGDPADPVATLSGGNQQKVVIAKWLMMEPEVILLNDPTRGIDVGAKYEMYGIMNALADQGKAIMMISSELPELLGICDRVFTLSAGRITGQVPVAEATQERLMTLMTQEKELVG